MNFDEKDKRIGMSSGPKFYFGKKPNLLSVTFLTRNRVIIGDEVYVIYEGDEKCREANELIRKYGIIIPLEGRYE